MPYFVVEFLTPPRPPSQTYFDNRRDAVLGSLTKLFGSGCERSDPENERLALALADPNNGQARPLIGDGINIVEIKAQPTAQIAASILKSRSIKTRANHMLQLRQTTAISKSVKTAHGFMFWSTNFPEIVDPNYP
jgi:hypothetical protein